MFVRLVEKKKKLEVLTTKERKAFERDFPTVNVKVLVPSRNPIFSAMTITLG